MKISIIGTGYVGLITGLCLAEMGHEIMCIDNDQIKIKKINNGESIIHEEGLEKLLKKNLGTNFLASCDLEEAVLNSEISIIAVGTPFKNEAIDLSYVKQVSKDIGKILSKKNTFHLIVVKSTVVPGTTDNVVTPIIEQYSKKENGIDFGVGMNPEFLREGSAINDFMNADRIILGSLDKISSKYMNKIYDPFPNVQKINTNNKTAEMIKYANNSLLATLISFSNEIGNLCSSHKNVDVLDVLRGVHLDQRISPILDNDNRVKPGIISYLQAGCGFGGSCFPKDVKALISHGDQQKSEMKLLKSVMEINNNQPSKVIDIVKRNFQKIKDLNILILGAAFKPGTDDMRESPAIPIINELICLEANINIYDPVAEEQAKKIFVDQNISFSHSLKDSILHAKVIILVTSWPEFDYLHDIINECDEKTLVIDGRRSLNKDKFTNYEGIGLS